MLTYFAHQTPDGSWHCVYQVPGTNVLHSVGAESCHEAAEREAARRNDAADATQAHRPEEAA